MGLKGSLQGLEWLIEEIEVSLHQAYQALESYLSEPSDVAQIRYCLNYLHQIHGSLRIVECPGPLLLAEEMKSLAEGMLEHQVDNTIDACDVMVQAILKLPAYLRQIMVSRKDQPETLLLLLNELRAVRGKAFVSETAFFSPNMQAAKNLSTPYSRKPDPVAMANLLRKLRQMYQFALAGVVKDETVSDNFGYLDKVFSRLKELSKGFPREPLWDAVLALLEGIAAKEIVLGHSVKRLLHELDEEISELARTGFDGLAKALPEPLLKNILFYVAYARSEHKRSVQVRKKYSLDSSLPEALLEDSSEGLSPMYHPDTAQAIVTALTEEISQIKELLDRYSVGDPQDFQLLDEIIVKLRRIKDSLAVLGRPELCEATVAACEQVLSLRANPSDTVSGCLSVVASQLMETESGLHRWLKHNGKLVDDYIPANENRVEVDRAQQALLEETRKGLDQIKECIVEFIASQWQRDKLDGVPEAIANIRGALEMMHLTRAAKVLDASNQFLVEQVLAEEAVPSWNMLDSLADAITSIEYYLEFIGRQDDESGQAILALAETGIAKLGYSVDGAKVEQTKINLSPAEPTLEPEVFAATIEKVDAEIIDIFLEEMEEIQELIELSFTKWAMDSTDEDSLGDLKRCFHTVKGSGRMVQAESLGELGWAIENVLNKIADKRIPITATSVALIDLAREEISGLTDAFKQQKIYDRLSYVEELMASADAMARGETVVLPEAGTVMRHAVRSGALPEVQSSSIEQPLSGTTTSYLDTIPIDIDPDELRIGNRESSTPPMNSAVLMDSGAPADLDGVAGQTERASEAAAELDHETQVLLDIFSYEAEEYLHMIQDFVDRQRDLAPAYEPVSSMVQSALHTIKGSSRMAEITPIAELITPLEHYSKELYTYQIELNNDIVQLFADAVGYCHMAIAPMRTEQRIGAIPQLDEFLERLKVLHDSLAGPSTGSNQTPQTTVNPELLNILMTEGMQGLLDVDETTLHWHHAAGDQSRLLNLRDELTHLAAAADDAGAKSMGELALLLGGAYDRIIAVGHQLDSDETALLQQSHEALLALVDCVAANQELPAVSVSLATGLETLANTDITHDIRTEPKDSTDELAELALTPVDTVAALSISPESQEQTPNVVIQHLNQEDIDLDILDIFISEADELLEGIEQALQNWERDQSSKDAVDALKRLLHTLKGGARMAGLEQLGLLSHELESEILLLEARPEQLNKEVFNRLLRQQDYLLEAVNAARHLFDSNENLPVRDDIADDAHSTESVSHKESDTVSLAGVETIEADMTVVDQDITVPASSAKLMIQTVLPPKVDSNIEPQFKPDSSSLSIPDIRRQAIPQDMTKVSAALLESMVNLAGETSISRGRVEQHVSEFAFTLDEMEATIQRLKDQVRRIGMETEAQVVFRQEQLEALSTDEGFDPLEMDRYSQLQQLSRSLLESASDLQDLKNTLVDKFRGADSELLAQSRINTDLQEQLMQTRMVPFVRVVPRLRRMVRQLSSELGKKVELYLTNVEGEMDRSVMEQMLAPLEHMIRNSIYHGIEQTTERVEAGKSEQGAISIGLVREGGDILIQLSDDGRGLNIDSIRQRAITLELMSEHSDLSDQEIIQFIFQPGFSTTTEITQVSGRGVGMDVVNSQVRELGGVIQTVTRSGKGTQFSIRLPFTVSVNRALMINIGEDRYALPLNSVDGVVRVSSMELEHYYRYPDARLEYAGGRYEVRYLGSLLSEELTPKVDMSVDSVFLVLIHSETRLYAVQVDSLAGSSEIVVKSLGPQFSKVPGLSGATLLGDGRVVVILDLLALLRVQVTARASMEVLSHSEKLIQSEVPTVMVVDDSVTVRKVASRFLEREGFSVVTARDGVEAMKLLQESKPDIMLLDIEMPRMDGFEVASRVKASKEWSKIPIIMITSRTGEKHHRRAMSLGVEGYLGKPYQEEELLLLMTKFMTNNESKQ